MEFNELSQKAVVIREKYSKINPRQWGVEQVFMGFIKDIGDLSKILMVSGGYRDDFDKDTKKELAHELSDILYGAMIIADKTGIDLEKSFVDTMDGLDKQFN